MHPPRFVDLRERTCAGRGAGREPRVGRRSARTCARAHQPLRQRHQCRGRAQRRRRPRRGPRSRRCARARRTPAAAGRADHGEGIVRRGRLRHQQRQPRLREQRGGAGFAGRCRAARRGRGDRRQEQRAARPGRPAELQRHLRREQQPVGHHAHTGRLLGRFGRCAGGGLCGAGAGHRHRRLDPYSHALQRRVRPQAHGRPGRDAWHHACPRAGWPTAT